MIQATTPSNFSSNTTKAGVQICAICHSCKSFTKGLCTFWTSGLSSTARCYLSTPRHTAVLILLPVAKSSISHLVPPCQISCHCRIWNAITLRFVSLESLTHCRVWVRWVTQLRGMEQRTWPLHEVTSTFTIQMMATGLHTFQSNSQVTHLTLIC